MLWFLLFLPSSSPPVRVLIAVSVRPALPHSNVPLHPRKRDHDPLELFLIVGRRKELPPDLQLLRFRCERRLLLKELYEHFVRRWRTGRGLVQIDRARRLPIVARSYGLVTHAIAVVVEQSPLGRERALLLVVAADGRGRSRERFPDGDAAVLVDIGGRILERVNEELREDGVEALRGAVGRRNHDSPRPRETLQERERRGRGVDNDETRRQPVEESRPLR